MAFRIAIFLVLILAINSLFSQSSIRGRVINREGYGLKGVHVHLANSSLGTITNSQGDFRLVLPTGSVIEGLTISHIGYKNRFIPYNALTRTITLAEQPTELDEVAIMPRDYARELVENAIKKIPVNYPNEEERHTGFLRESTSWDKTGTNPIYVVETVLETIKKPYAKTKSPRGHVRIVESRKHENSQIDSLNYRIYGGHHHLNRFDIVSKRIGPLANPSAYSFELIDTTSLNGKDVYEVFFHKKNEAQGHLYIMDSTFAFVKGVFHYEQFSPFKIEDRNRVFLDFTIEYYHSFSDNRWRYKYSHYNTAFDRNKRILFLTSEYTSSNVVTNPGEIAYVERAHYRDILFNNQVAYDSNFWSNHTIIQSNDEVELLFNQEDSKQSTLSSKTEKAIKALSRLRSSIEVVYQPIDLGSYTLTYSNPQFFINLTDRKQTITRVGLSSGLHYELDRSFVIGIKSLTTFSIEGVFSADIEMLKEMKLNSHGRPWFISPGFSLGYQLLSHSLETVNSNDSFKVKKKEFDSGQTDLYLQQRSIRFRPFLLLGIEKNQRIQFYISAGYNVALSNNTGVLFDETNQFFLKQKTSFLKNGEENLSISNSSGLFPTNYFYSTVGLFITPF